MEAEAAGALAAEASSQMGGSEQALWAVCAQLRALPELADCSDLAWYLAKKYAPAAERAGKLVPVKNKRFGELARVQMHDFGHTNAWLLAGATTTLLTSPAASPLAMPHVRRQVRYGGFGTALR